MPNSSARPGPKSVEARGRQVQRYFENVERFLGGGERARQDAILAVSALVGSIVLARAVDDQALSDEILSAVGNGISELR